LDILLRSSYHRLEQDFFGRLPGFGGCQVEPVFHTGDLSGLFFGIVYGCPKVIGGKPNASIDVFGGDKDRKGDPERMEIGRDHPRIVLVSVVKGQQDLGGGQPAVADETIIKIIQGDDLEILAQVFDLFLELGKQDVKRLNPGIDDLLFHPVPEQSNGSLFELPGKPVQPGKPCSRGDASFQ